MADERRGAKRGRLRGYLGAVLGCGTPEVSPLPLGGARKRTLRCRARPPRFRLGLEPWPGTKDPTCP
ncbi:hypothetical protein NDU88_003975 [Pleurodeles waltl]|uniref:Uncharacterized protein n=1 Tax=Pleurodeles waltl TaxID=8319 RepID=A0AAV7TSN3_PLEWA|nr:hypothetical protein NDU88_003975 [Pleurodeles waltl]